MSVREKAYNIIDSLTDEQLEGFVMMFEKIVPADIPNAETIEALEEVEYMKKNPEKYKGYTSADEMIKELLG